MDYLTIHINKTFLLFLVLLILAVVGVKQAYNYGVNEGWNRAFLYIQHLQEQGNAKSEKSL